MFLYSSIVPYSNVVSYSSTVPYSDVLPCDSVLLNSNTLCKVPRLIDVLAAGNCGIVGQQLQRDDRKTGEEMTRLCS